MRLASLEFLYVYKRFSQL